MTMCRNKLRPKLFNLQNLWLINHDYRHYHQRRRRRHQFIQKQKKHLQYILGLINSKNSKPAFFRPAKVNLYLQH